MKTVEGKRFREPRNLGDIESATGFEECDLKGKLGSRASPSKALEFLDEEILRGSRGEGMHFWFPLTRMKYMGEFMKGALSEMAPYARVTMLVTPAASSFGKNLGRLKSNVEGAKNEGDTRNILFDNFVNHTTERPLTQAFDGNLEIYDTRSMGAGILEKFSHVEKDVGGEFALGSGYLLDYLIKHPDVDPDIKFRNVGYVIENKILTNGKKYFNEGEIRELSKKAGKPLHSFYSYPRENRKREWIEYIKGLSRVRQKQIIDKMNWEDAQTSKAMFMYGKAYAKDFMAENTRLHLPEP